MSRRHSRTWFGVGLLAGLVTGYGLLRVSGFAVVSEENLQERQDLISELRKENHELTEELLQPRLPAETGWSAGFPYDEGADARDQLVIARQEAVKAGKFLMVTFGANWCLDCRNLHRMLNDGEVAAYTKGLFDFVNVDIGKFNKNLDTAAELGVTLKKGIPVAIVFDPNGKVIGTTNEGQLEPARYYSSKQILRFVKDIAEGSRIIAPNAVRR